MKKAVILVLLSLVLFLVGCESTGTTYNINFDSQNGEAVISAVINPNDPSSVPNDPVKDGYQFVGWYWDNSTFAVPFTINSILDAPLSNSLTVYAKWQEKTTTLDTTLLSIYTLMVEATSSDMTYEEWLESVTGPQGEPGTDGKDVMMRIEDGVLQWQHENDAVWTDLLNLSSLQGTDGTDGVDGIDGINAKNIQLQVSDGYIQWQLVGDTAWTNLIELTSLIGANGSDGIDGVDGKEVTFQVADGYIQWQYTGNETWNNLISIDLLQGADGVDGTDGTNGREVELRTYSGNIQWKYSDSTTWTDLFNMYSLTPSVSVVVNPILKYSLNAYATITSASYGVLPGDATYIDHTLRHTIYQVSNPLNLPIDTHTGLPTGAYSFEPVEIIMAVNSTTPLLYEMCTNGSMLTSFVIDFFRLDELGREENFYRIELENATIVGINMSHYAMYQSEDQPYYDMVTLQLIFETINWIDPINGIETTEHWIDLPI